MEAATHYEVLGVDERASRVQIKAAYQRMVLHYHPDRAASSPPKGPAHHGEDPIAFQRIQQAWTVLRDACSRTAYDRHRYGACTRLDSLPSFL